MKRLEEKYWCNIWSNRQHDYLLRTEFRYTSTDEGECRSLFEDECMGKKIHISVCFLLNYFGEIFHKLIIFKCLLGFLNPAFSSLAVTELNVLGHILLYGKLDPHYLRGEGTMPVCPPAHRSQTHTHSLEAPPSGLSTKLPHYKYVSSSQGNGFFSAYVVFSQILI
jgi:hypothetical protein